jgi:hypothetical protein
MLNAEVVAALDAEIARLHQARNLIASSINGLAPVKRANTLAKTTKTLAVRDTAAAPRTRIISPEGKARIAAAQRLRWAKRKRPKQ